MFFCNGCKHYFDAPQIFTERHGLSEPPFEKFAVCPFCRDTNFGNDERRRRYAKR